MNVFNQKIKSSELIINKDGSIYHLHLLPEDIAETILLVGDPDRVAMVSDCFDSIELKKQKREFITHTGSYKGKRFTVISTGIGTDNIDIVMNELDALVNINLQTGTLNNEIRSLDIVRIGTSGSLQEDIGVDDILVSTYGLGLDLLMHYYNWQPTNSEISILNQITKQATFPILSPYLVGGSEKLLKKFNQLKSGITVTTSGFYAPQGRQLRAKVKLPKIIHELSAVKIEPNRITNFEMETAAIYGLSRISGFHAISVNAIMANRVSGTFSKSPTETIQKTIHEVLESLVKP